MLINCGGGATESESPIDRPSVPTPTTNQTDAPIVTATARPATIPTVIPITVPTMPPVVTPTIEPTAAPIPTVAPTVAPTAVPTSVPSMEPTTEPNPNSRPYLGTPFLLPIVVEAEDYNIDGFMDLTNENRGGAYREESVDISPAGEGYAVTWTESREWLEYSVLTTETQSFDLSILYSSRDQKGIISVYSGSDILVSDTELPETGDWNQYRSYKLDPFTLQEGEHKVRINIVKAGINIDSLDFQLSPAPTNTIAPVYKQQCAACHGEAGEAGVGGSIIEMCIHTDCDNQDVLAQYIAEEIPKGQTSRCEGQCATDMARYVREVLRSDVLTPMPTPVVTSTPIVTPAPVVMFTPTPEPTSTPNPPVNSDASCQATGDFKPWHRVE